jgi:hypothetical protein
MALLECCKSGSKVLVFNDAVMHHFISFQIASPISLKHYPLNYMKNKKQRRTHLDNTNHNNQPFPLLLLHAVVRCYTLLYAVIRCSTQFHAISHSGTLLFAAVHYTVARYV